MIDLIGDKLLWYSAQQIEGGPDAAIEAADGNIHAFIDGCLCPSDHEFSTFVKKYEHALLRGASENMGSSDAKIVFLGKWSDVDTVQTPRFIGYLVHVVSETGDVRTRRYLREFADWDDAPDDEEASDVVEKATSGKVFLRTLRKHAEELILLDERQPAPTGRHYVDGVIYEPACLEDGPLPFIVIKAIGITALANEEKLACGDELLNAAFVRYNADLDDFRGQAVADSAFGDPSDQLQRAYCALKRSADALGSLDYQLRLHEVARRALAGTPFGIFRDKVRRQDDLVEGMNFQELYDIRAIDRVTFEVIDNGSPGPMEKDVKDIEGKLYTYEWFFTERFRKEASGYVVQTVARATCESYGFCYNFVSDWRQSRPNRKGRMVARASASSAAAAAAH